MKLATYNVFVDLHARLLLKLEKLLSSQTDALKAVVAAAVAQITTAIATEGQLKQKLDAALADNVAKAAALTAADATITDLQAKLAAALSGQADPNDAQAVTEAGATLQTAVQALSDANAVNAPSN